jgi:hypothetical protein
MTYQSEKDDQIYEGGVLQFSVSLKLEERRLKDLAKELKSKLRYNSDDVKLVPLPFRLAEATIYDASGKAVTKAPQSPSLAPSYVTGSLPFQAKLDKFGADLYSALIDSNNNGIGVLMLLTFEGILPEAGFKVTVDYKRTWEYFNKDSGICVDVGYWLLGAKVNVDRTRIRENLVQNGCIKVESISGEAVDQSLIDKYLDPIIARIGDQLFDKILPPEEIATEYFDEPELMKKCFFPARVKTRTSLIDIKKVKDIKETIEFNAAVTVERKTSCGTFIGINKYSEAQKKSLISVMPLNNWASAFLILPDVDNNSDLNLVSVNMTANVVDKSGNPISGLSETASWKASSPEAWVNKDGKKTYNLSFPLMSLFDKQDNDMEKIQSEYFFDVGIKINQKLDSFATIETGYRTKMFDGDLPLAQPVDLVDNLVFDLSLLDFDSSEGLKKVRIEAQKDSLLLKKTLTGRNTNKTAVFIVPSGSAEKGLKARMFFDEARRGGDRNIPWKHNDKDLRELNPALYFLLFDSDWQNN